MKSKGILAGAGLWLAGAFVSWALFAPHGRIVTAHGVWSQCGFYDIVAIYDNGKAVSHAADAPVTEELMELIRALPAESRLITIVPCPTLQVPQREAKNQEKDPASAPGQAAGDGPHRPRAG